MQEEENPGTEGCRTRALAHKEVAGGPGKDPNHREKRLVPTHRKLNWPGSKKKHRVFLLCSWCEDGLSQHRTLRGSLGGHLGPQS